jgi:hypothetical protein
MSELRFRQARPDDERRLQTIRSAAFVPVFASSLMATDSIWELYVAELGGEVVGFVAVRVDATTKAGMRVATVGTGGDPSHAPARRAYEKAGFNLQIPSVWMYRKL